MDNIEITKQDIESLSVEELIDLKFKLDDMIRKIDELIEECDEALN